VLDMRQSLSPTDTKDRRGPRVSTIRAFDNARKTSRRVAAVLTGLTGHLTKFDLLATKWLKKPT
jgi:hypothetical protein